MADALQIFKVVIILQLFYALAITLVVHNLPPDVIASQQTNPFTDVSEQINLANVSTEVQDSLQSQTNIPVVDIGALVLFSGNILIDLLLNFAFAIPQMITLLINGLMMLLNIDQDITIQIQLFASVAIMVLYFVQIMQLLTNVRSGRVV